MGCKVCVVTGTRAEYGLLRWLINDLNESPATDLQLIATGTHLSPEFGLTISEIRDDGFRVDYEVEMLLSVDTASGVSKSMGMAMIGFSDAFRQLRPDILIVLGDRSEIMAAVCSAAVARIPVAHIHGGEKTEGAYDEFFRHAITKMAHYHFTSTAEYRRRVIQLGEDPDRVITVGALGAENLKRLTLLSKKETEEATGFSFGNKNLLITYHPVTLSSVSSESQIETLLRALEGIQDTHFLFTKPNSDSGNHPIAKMIDRFVSDYPGRAISFTSLGALRYLSVMKWVDGVVGNSSSGIIEAPSAGVGTINIGERQQGRIQANSVLNCDCSVDAIRNAVKKLYSPQFKKLLGSIKNPYDSGVSSSGKICSFISSIQYPVNIKKNFHDISMNSSEGLS